MVVGCGNEDISNQGLALYGDFSCYYSDRCRANGMKSETSDPYPVLGLGSRPEDGMESAKMQTTAFVKLLTTYNWGTKVSLRW